MVQPVRVPLRRCRVCRSSRPKGELLRWVKGAGDQGPGLIADPSFKAPGRGYYACASNPHCIEILPRTLGKTKGRR